MGDPEIWALIELNWLVKSTLRKAAWARHTETDDYLNLQNWQKSVEKFDRLIVHFVSKYLEGNLLRTDICTNKMKQIGVQFSLMDQFLGLLFKLSTICFLKNKKNEEYEDLDKLLKEEMFVWEYTKILIFEAIYNTWMDVTVSLQFLPKYLQNRI